jgi:hypothetical protein
MLFFLQIWYNYTIHEHVFGHQKLKTKFRNLLATVTVTLWMRGGIARALS